MLILWKSALLFFWLLYLNMVLLLEIYYMVYEFYINKQDVF